MILLAQLLLCQGIQGEDLRSTFFNFEVFNNFEGKLIRTEFGSIITFRASTRVSWNPSPNKLISAIILLSGTIIEIGLNMDFKLSGSSVRPAYPGFIVMNIPQVPINLISLPSKTNLWSFWDSAVNIDNICCATTDNTSILILWNEKIHRRENFINIKLKLYYLYR